MPKSPNFGREKHLSPDERGLGHLTPGGADTLLLWDEEVFYRLCPQVVHPETCALGYPSLPEEIQALVQGAVLRQVDATCPDCIFGIDFDVADQSIEIFAKVLKANCRQVGQTIINLRGQPPGLVSDYEDLWRFALVNYHAGVGCLTSAFNTIPIDQPLTWENIVPALEAECPGGSKYVNDVTGE